MNQKKENQNKKSNISTILKNRKQIKKYNNQINQTQTSYYRILNYITGQYYYSLKKEFTYNEIIKSCNTTNETLNELKTYLEKKEHIKMKKNKITVDYETILVFEEMLNNHKSFYLNQSLGLFALVVSDITLAIAIFQTSTINVLIVIITIIVFAIMVKMIYNDILKTKLDQIIPTIYFTNKKE